MDKYNVIDQIYNLNDLENDMVQWSMLPYKFRMMSDDDCQRMHGMTNTEYYNAIKAKLIGLGQEIQESAENIGDLFDLEDMEYRYQLSASVQKSPNFVIIDPNTMTVEELNRKYQAWMNLTERNRLFSNEYSFSIWGFNVPDMYNIFKTNMCNHLPDDGTNTDDVLEEHQNIAAIRGTIDSIIATSEHMIFDDDKIGLCEVLNNLEQSDVTGKAIVSLYRKCMIENAITNNVYYDEFPKIVPYLTVSEMSKLAPESNIASYSYDEWLSEVKEAVNSGNEQRILNAGWNPSIPFNEDGHAIARDRQRQWLQEYTPRIIDIQNIGKDLVINESSRQMVALYEQKNLYPVYIVTSWTNTLFGKIERLAMRNVFYSHAGMTLDSDLKHIFTFKFGKETNGFEIESIEDYKAATDKSFISVIAIFVNKGTRNRLNNILKEFAKNRQKTKYAFGNLINILLRRSKEFPYPENMQLVCSQFVDTVLKLVDIDITNKPSNLVIPQDLAAISVKPKVYKVYEGFCKNYNEKKVESDIRSLFERSAVQNIKYKEPIEINFTEHCQALLEDLLTPEAVIIEKKLPIRFTKDGDLSIDLYKDLEQQYQESHKLLTGYTENSLDGIKHELAHLFYINSIIENKIKKMKKGDPKYKQLIDLRARVLNDFTKYFKMVTDKEPSFDFSRYYQKSDYYNGALTIDRTTMKYSGKLIKQFLTAQGI